MKYGPLIIEPSPSTIGSDLDDPPWERRGARRIIRIAPRSDLVTIAGPVAVAVRVEWRGTGVCGRNKIVGVRLVPVQEAVVIAVVVVGKGATLVFSEVARKIAVGIEGGIIDSDDEIMGGLPMVIHIIIIDIHHFTIGHANVVDSGMRAFIIVDINRESRGARGNRTERILSPLDNPS